MMRFDKSNSFCAAAPQLEDKNGNFDQKNDFSALDHFFCTLCSLFILDFIFFFFTYNRLTTQLFIAWFKCLVSGVSCTRIVVRRRRNSRNQIFSYSAHSVSGVFTLNKNIKNN